MAPGRRCWRAGFRGRVVSYDGDLPRELDPPMGPPDLVAVVLLGAASDATRRRLARAGKRIVSPWRFANLMCGTALLATRVDLRWELIATGQVSRPRGPLPP